MLKCAHPQSILRELPCLSVVALMVFACCVYGVVVGGELSITLGLLCFMLLLFPMMRYILSGCEDVSVKHWGHCSSVVLPFVLVGCCSVALVLWFAGQEVFLSCSRSSSPLSSAARLA